MTMAAIVQRFCVNLRILNKLSIWIFNGGDIVTPQPITYDYKAVFNEDTFPIIA